MNPKPLRVDSESTLGRSTPDLGPIWPRVVSLGLRHPLSDQELEALRLRNEERARLAALELGPRWLLATPLRRRA